MLLHQASCKPGMLLPSSVFVASPSTSTTSTKHPTFTYTFRPSFLPQVSATSARARLLPLSGRKACSAAQSVSAKAGCFRGVTAKSAFESSRDKKKQNSLESKKQPPPTSLLHNIFRKTSSAATENSSSATQDVSSSHTKQSKTVRISPGSMYPVKPDQSAQCPRIQRLASFPTSFVTVPRINYSTEPSVSCVLHSQKRKSIPKQTTPVSTMHANSTLRASCPSTSIAFSHPVAHPLETVHVLPLPLASTDLTADFPDPVGFTLESLPLPCAYLRLPWPPESCYCRLMPSFNGHPPIVDDERISKAHTLTSVSPTLEGVVTKDKIPQKLSSHTLIIRRMFVERIASSPSSYLIRYVYSPAIQRRAKWPKRFTPFSQNATSGDTYYPLSAQRNLLLDVDHKEDDDELFAAELIKRSHNMFRATQLLGLGFSSAGAFVTHTHSAEAEQEESIQEDVCLIYFRLKFRDLPFSRRQLERDWERRRTEIRSNVTAIVVIFDFRFSELTCSPASPMSNTTWSPDSMRRIVHLTAQTHSILDSWLINNLEGRELSIIHLPPTSFAALVDSSVAKAHQQLGLPTNSPALVSDCTRSVFAVPPKPLSYQPFKQAVHSLVQNCSVAYGDAPASPQPFDATAPGADPACCVSSSTLSIAKPVFVEITAIKSNETQDRKNIFTEGAKQNGYDASLEMSACSYPTVELDKIESPEMEQPSLRVNTTAKQLSVFILPDTPAVPKTPPCNTPCGNSEKLRQRTYTPPTSGRNVSSVPHRFSAVSSKPKALSSSHSGGAKTIDAQKSRRLGNHAVQTQLLPSTPCEATLSAELLERCNHRLKNLTVHRSMSNKRPPEFPDDVTECTLHGVTQIDDPCEIVHNRPPVTHVPSVVGSWLDATAFGPAFCGTCGIWDSPRGISHTVSRRRDDLTLYNQSNKLSSIINKTPDNETSNVWRAVLQEHQADDTSSGNTHLDNDCVQDTTEILPYANPFDSSWNDSHHHFSVPKFETQQQQPGRRHLTVSKTSLASVSHTEFDDDSADHLSSHRPWTPNSNADAAAASCLTYPRALSEAPDASHLYATTHCANRDHSFVTENCYSANPCLIHTRDHSLNHCATFLRCAKHGNVNKACSSIANDCCVQRHYTTSCRATKQNSFAAHQKSEQDIICRTSCQGVSQRTTSPVSTSVWQAEDTQSFASCASEHKMASGWTLSRQKSRRVVARSHHRSRPRLRRRRESCRIKKS